jgi:hypothetical protein
MISHCTTDGQREKYISQLRKHVQVDIFGSCNEGEPQLNCDTDEFFSSAPECYNILESNYKFYFSFENSICPDYDRKILSNHENARHSARRLRRRQLCWIGTEALLHTPCVSGHNIWPPIWKCWPKTRHFTTNIFVGRTTTSLRPVCSKWSVRVFVTSAWNWIKLIKKLKCTNRWLHDGILLIASVHKMAIIKRNKHWRAKTFNLIRGEVWSSFLKNYIGVIYIIKKSDFRELLFLQLKRIFGINTQTVMLSLRV